MAGFVIEISKLDTTHSVPYPKIPSSGLTVTLRVNPYSGTTYSLTEVGTTGVYGIATVNDGQYKLYIGGAEQTAYQTFWIGDSAPRFDTIAERTAATGVTIDGVLIKDSLNASSIMALTGNQECAGVKSFQGSIKTNTISEYGAGSGVTIDGIGLIDDLDTSNIVTKSAVDQTIAGVKTFSAQTNHTGAIVGTSTLAVSGQVTFNTQCAKYGSTFAISNDVDIPHKAYVDDAITAASGNYTESINVVSVFPELGATIPGVAYSGIASAIASFTSPSITKQCCVLIKGTGATSQYITFNVSTLVDYVHIKGLHKRINIVPDIAVETSTAQNMMFENCSVFFGIKTITDARTMENIHFVYCDLYAYNDITFTGSYLKLIDCNIYSASGHDITYTGAGQIMGCRFMQNTTASSWTGVYAGNYDNCNNSFSMPADPSPSP